MASRTHFVGLPDEIVKSILGMISDAKCLLNCYLTSKFFASVVAQSRTISVEIPSPNHAVDSVEIGPVWPQEVFRSLRIFTRAETFTIRFIDTDPRPQEEQFVNPLVRWKCDSSTFVVLHARSHTIDPYFGNEKLQITVQEGLSVEDLADFRVVMDDILKDCTSKITYIKELVDAFPDLKRISAVDPHGKLIVGEKDIADSKFFLPRFDPDEGLARSYFTQTWAIPLHTFSGYVMYDLALVVMKRIGSWHVDMVKDAFEEKTLCEMAKKMMELKVSFVGSLSITPCYFTPTYLANIDTQLFN